MGFRLRRLDAFLRRFGRANRGAAAVEFAFVGVPFILLVMGVIELGMVLLVSTTLEGALDTAARRVRTGEVQTTGLNVGALKTTICNEMSFLGSTCLSKLNLDVRSFASFNAVTTPNPVNGTSFDQTKMCWDPGGAGSVVLVTAYYPWTIITPVLNEGLVNLSGGKRIMRDSAVFKNEPYNNTAVTPSACPASYPGAPP